MVLFIMRVLLVPPINCVALVLFVNVLFMIWFEVEDATLMPSALSRIILCRAIALPPVPKSIPCLLLPTTRLYSIVLPDAVLPASMPTRLFLAVLFATTLLGAAATSNPSFVLDTAVSKSNVLFVPSLSKPMLFEFAVLFLIILLLP